MSFALLLLLFAAMATVVHSTAVKCNDDPAICDGVNWAVNPNADNKNCQGSCTPQLCCTAIKCGVWGSNGGCNGVNYIVNSANAATTCTNKECTVDQCCSPNTCGAQWFANGHNCGANLTPKDSSTLCGASCSETQCCRDQTCEDYAASITCPANSDFSIPTALCKSLLGGCLPSTCCIPRSCNKPTDAAIVNAYNLDNCGATSCTVTCKSGYHFEAPVSPAGYTGPFALCAANNGVWNPKGCLPDKCDSISFQNGCGSSADLNSDAACTRSPAVTGQCTSDVCCTPRSCNEPDATTAAGYTVTGCQHSSTVCTVGSTCNPGWHLVGSTSALCSKKNTPWTLSGCVQDTCRYTFPDGAADCPSSLYIFNDNGVCGSHGCQVTDCCYLPKCSVPSGSAADPYTWTNCTNTDELTCTIDCADGYYAASTPTVHCNINTGKFVPSGCQLKKCLTPSNPVGYVLPSKCVDASCDGVTCDSGYYPLSGQHPIALCETNGHEFALYGCAATLCIEPDWTNSGYQKVTPGTSCNNLHTCAVQCAEGYHSPNGATPTATCATQHSTFKLSGCVPNRCTKPKDPRYVFGDDCNGQSTSCTVDCQNGYVKTNPKAVCAQDGSPFQLSGCDDPSCVAPPRGPAWVGYQPLDACVGKSCNVGCDDGYHGNAPTATCPGQGQQFQFDGCDPNQCHSPDKDPKYTVNDNNNCNNQASCSVQCATGYMGTPQATCPQDGGKFQLSGCQPMTCGNSFTGRCADGYVLQTDNTCSSGTCTYDNCCIGSICTVPEPFGDSLHGCGLTCNCPNQASCEDGSKKINDLKCFWDGQRCVRQADVGTCSTLVTGTCLVIDDPLDNAKGCGNVNGLCSCPNEVSCNNHQDIGCVWITDSNANTILSKPGKGWGEAGYCARKVSDPTLCGCKCNDVNCAGGYVDAGCSKSCGGTQLQVCRITAKKFLNGASCPCTADDVQTTTRSCNDNCPKGDFNNCGGTFILGDCSVSCGGGTRTDTYYMSAVVNDADCQGFNMTTIQVPCNTQKCKKNCKGSWKATACSATCGQGITVEEFVVDEVESDGGSCPDRDASPRQRPDQPCQNTPCPVDCQGTFVDDSVCDQPCGGGQIRRKYVHTNKDDYNAHPGKACDHDDGWTTTVPCNTPDCQCDGYWDPQGACTASCGGGKQNKKWHDTVRQSDKCPHKPDETGQDDCNTQDCPIDCDGDWYQKDGAKCSASCGQGTITWEFRVAHGEQHGGKCPQRGLTKEVPCDAGDCPEDCVGGTIDGDCSRSCGGGLKVVKYLHLKDEKNGGNKCPLDNGAKKIKQCNTDPCPVHCEGHWEHKPCDRSCGFGKAKSVFVVTKKKAHGGNDCEANDGDSFDSDCATFPCPVDCSGKWEEGVCSKSCLGGTAVHTFKIDQYELYGGKPCDNPHGATKIAPCNTGPCKYPCVGNWKDEGICSRTCGGGSQLQKFHITQKASPGGKSCDFAEGDTQTLKCHTNPCNVDCVGFWKDEGHCSRPCGTDGTVQQTFVVKQRSHGTGLPCLADDGKTLLDDGEYHYRLHPCNVRPCSQDCLGAWESASGCSKTCGWGVTTLTYVHYKEKSGDGHDCDHAIGKLVTKPCHLKSCNPYHPPSEENHKPVTALPPVPPPDPVRQGTDCIAKWVEVTTCSKTCGWGHITEKWEVDTPATFQGSCEHHDGKTRTKPCIVQKCPPGVPSTSSDGAGAQLPVDQNCKGHWQDTEKCSKPCGGGKLTHRWIIDTPQKGKGRPCDHTDHFEEEGDQDCNTDDCPAPPPVCARHENRWEVVDGNIVRQHGCGWTCNCPNKESCTSGVAKQNCHWDDSNLQCLLVVKQTEIDDACNKNVAKTCYEWDAPLPENGCGKGCHCPNQHSQQNMR